MGDCSSYVEIVDMRDLLSYNSVFPLILGLWVTVKRKLYCLVPLLGCRLFANIARVILRVRKKYFIYQLGIGRGIGQYRRYILGDIYYLAKNPLRHLIFSINNHTLFF